MRLNIGESKITPMGFEPMNCRTLSDRSTTELGMAVVDRTFRSLPGYAILIRPPAVIIRQTVFGSTHRSQVVSHPGARRS